MKHRKLIWLFLLVLAVSQSLSAQVEKAVADAEGITWASCAAVMEVALRRLDGVDKVAISIERQQFVVLYKPGASFQPKDLRAAVAQASVSVAQFHIQARGRVQIEGAKQFFVAGKDRFLLVDSPKMPADVPLVVGGDVNDKVTPLQLKVSDFKPLDKQ